VHLSYSCPLPTSQWPLTLSLLFLSTPQPREERRDASAITQCAIPAARTRPLVAVITRWATLTMRRTAARPSWLPRPPQRPPPWNPQVRLPAPPASHPLPYIAPALIPAPALILTTGRRPRSRSRTDAYQRWQRQQEQAVEKSSSRVVLLCNLRPGSHTDVKKHVEVRGKAAAATAYGRPKDGPVSHLGLPTPVRTLPASRRCLPTRSSAAA
jgi:hypothetical protein